MVRKGWSAFPTPSGYNVVRATSTIRSMATPSAVELSCSAAQCSGQGESPQAQVAARHEVQGNPNEVQAGLGSSDWRGLWLFLSVGVRPKFVGCKPRGSPPRGTGRDDLFFGFDFLC